MPTNQTSESLTAAMPLDPLDIIDAAREEVAPDCYSKNPTVRLASNVAYSILYNTYRYLSAPEDSAEYKLHLTGLICRILPVE